jgi:membrane-associated phospholipid phosphatase
MSSTLATTGRTSTAAPQRHQAAANPSRLASFGWLAELALLRGFELSYTWVKDQAQSAAAKDTAYANANRLVEWQRTINLFVEPQLQRLVIDLTWLVRALNLYYTTMHFGVTVAVLVWLYVRRRASYATARTVLIVSSMLALIGYFAFPLAPPRLYPCNCIVDTLDVVGGSWSYYSAQVSHIANPYAAMPSVHMSWALWCALVLWRVGGRRSLRWAAVAHAVLTLVAIVLTGNHYWLDAVGGAAVLLVGASLTNWLRRLRRQLRPAETLFCARQQVAGVSNG